MNAETALRPVRPHYCQIFRLVVVGLVFIGAKMPTCHSDTLICVSPGQELDPTRYDYNEYCVVYVRVVLCIFLKTF